MTHDKVERTMTPMVGVPCRRASRPATLASLLTFIPLTFALSACTDTGRVSGGSCIVNQDCPTGEQCVGGRCVMQAAIGCKNDDACDLGESCNPVTKQCEPETVTGCSTDDICPAEQRCNTLTGVCIDGRRSCTGESQCTPIGKHCDISLHQCVDCVTTTDCPSPNVCLNDTCVDPSTASCTDDAMCSVPDTVCAGTMCVPGCHRPGSPIVCRLGQLCDSSTGRCVTGQSSCATDAECTPPATICESQTCIPGCTQIGGLQCTGGNVCNEGTGRCEASSGCTTDAQCGAPAGVCENNTCIPGCGQVGGLQCGAGSVCDTNTGRCVTVQGPCSSDPQCGAPVGVCESGQCIPGCGQTGGLQCTGNTICNASTGRCDPGTAVCMSDAACGPPSLICDLNSGQCVSGCLSTGCTSNEMCNNTTGHCEPVVMGLPLNSTCTADADCQSDVCFDLGGAIGARCISACGNSVDCPANFTCYDYEGGKMCVHSSLFSSATFATANGGACSSGTDCHSNFCSSGTCVDTCSEDSDCTNGSECMWYEFGPNSFIGSCEGPYGFGSNGSSCTASSDCNSGVCYGAGICGDVCGSTVDCPSSDVCGLVNYSICTISFNGDCLQWSPNFVKACLQSSSGSGAVGASCSSFSQCRSSLCYTTYGTCTDTCSRDSDCPSTHVCGVEEWGQLNVLAGDPVIVYINVCRPR